jgi:hypothetical protein
MMTSFTTNPSASRKTKAMAISRGRTCTLKDSIHLGRLAARTTEPQREVIANHRHGNCTSDSFGITAQSGRLRGVVKIRLVTVTIAAAISPRLLARSRMTRRRKSNPGKRNAIIASPTRFAYHVFRFASALGEKRKFNR